MSEVTWFRDLGARGLPWDHLWLPGSASTYATPLGVRPAPGGGFVVPLTFSEASHWYQNIRAAGGCVITYRGVDHTVTRPTVVDRATAGPAYPRYERLALQLIGINEFVLLTEAPAGSATSAMAS